MTLAWACILIWLVVVGPSVWCSTYRRAVRRNAPVIEIEQWEKNAASLRIRYLTDQIDVDQYVSLMDRCEHDQRPVTAVITQQRDADRARVAEFLARIYP